MFQSILPTVERKSSQLSKYTVLKTIILQIINFILKTLVYKNGCRRVVKL